MRKALGEQMGRNADAYVDDIVIKSREARTLVEDLEEMFTNIWKVNIKLNPAKCTFAIPSRKLLGFLVLHYGIEESPNKVKAIVEMHPLCNLKEMQRFAACMAAQGRFIARSREKALPFFKLMKHTSKFEWTPEADRAFIKVNRYLTSPPIMVAPRTHGRCFSTSRPHQEQQVLSSSSSEKVKYSPRRRWGIHALGLPPREESSPLNLPHEGPTPTPPAPKESLFFASPL
jgi:hypothetical protein